MIIEGLVTIKQEGREISTRNHVLAPLAFRLLGWCIGSTISASLMNLMAVSNYLMRTFQIRLGSGNTQTPAHNLTALQTESATMISFVNTLIADYAVASPFDVVYSAAISKENLLNSFAGVTIPWENVQGYIAGIGDVDPTEPVLNGKYLIEQTYKQWDGADWVILTPALNWVVVEEGTEITYRFDGTNWVIVPNVREAGLFTFGIAPFTTFKQTVSYTYSNSHLSYGNTYFLAAYISANHQESPDFLPSEISLIKDLTIDWTIRIGFSG